MMSDQQAVIGTTAAFHLSRATVKLNHAITTKTGHYHVALDAHPATRVYLAHRSLVQIVGPVSVSLVGPASADIVASATATIAATRATSWPDTVLKVADAAESQNLATSALSTIPRAVLEFHPDINRVLKPRPQSGDHPEFVAAWSIQTSATAPPVGTRLEVVFDIEFSGSAWIQPASW